MGIVFYSLGINWIVKSRHSIIIISLAVNVLIKWKICKGFIIYNSII